DHLVGVLVDELPDPVDDGVTELVVDVVVVAHLHDHHARLDAEPVQRAAYALSGAASVPAHGLLPPYLGPGLASHAGRPGAQPTAATTPPLARLPGPGPYGRSPPTVARSAPARPSPAGAAAEMAAAARPARPAVTTRVAATMSRAAISPCAEATGPVPPATK